MKSASSYSYKAILRSAAGGRPPALMSAPVGKCASAIDSVLMRRADGRRAPCQRVGNMRFRRTATPHCPGWRQTPFARGGMDWRCLDAPSIGANPAVRTIRNGKRTIGEPREVELNWKRLCAEWLTCAAIAVAAAAVVRAVYVIAGVYT